MNGIVSAIYASFILAIGETTLKKSFRDFVPSVGFFFNSIAGLVIIPPVALLLGGDIGNFFQVLPYALLSAMLSEALYFYALSKGQLSITSILLSTYPVYTILFSYFILGERLTGRVWPFIIMTILGTLISYLPSKLSRKELIMSQALIWPIIAAICAAFSDVLAKGIINQTSAYDFLLALAVVQVPVAFAYLKLERQNLRASLSDVMKQPGDYFHAMVGGTLSIIGTALLWVAFNYVEASVASPIVATSGAIIVLFATLFLDERMRWRNALGIMLIFIGVLGISAITGV